MTYRVVIRGDPHLIHKNVMSGLAVCSNHDSGQGLPVRLSTTTTGLPALLWRLHPCLLVSEVLGDMKADELAKALAAQLDQLGPQVLLLLKRRVKLDPAFAQTFSLCPHLSSIPALSSWSPWWAEYFKWG